MSGHSKWANIKHRKGAQDAIRARQFTKAGREIIVAVRAGGPDAEANPRLRAAIVAALQRLVPEYRPENPPEAPPGGGAGAGAAVAAQFLTEFAGDTPWVHLDIAGTSETDKEKGYQPKGATGVMVRTLVNLAVELLAE